MSTEEQQKPVEDITKKMDGLKVDDDTRNKGRRPRPTDEERQKIWEERQAKKAVLEKAIKGTVKWYSVRGRYGFIERTDNGNDVFVHQTAIAVSSTIKTYLRTLDDGEEVEFDVVKGDKGPEAANLSGPDRAEVHGSRFFRSLYYRPFGRRPFGQRRREDGEKGGDGERPRRPYNQRRHDDNEEGEGERRGPRRNGGRGPARRPYGGGQRRHDDNQEEGEGERRGPPRRPYGQRRREEGEEGERRGPRRDEGEGGEGEGGRGPYRKRNNYFRKRRNTQRKDGEGEENEVKEGGEKKEGQPRRRNNTRGEEGAQPARRRTNTKGDEKKNGEKKDNHPAPAKESKDEKKNDQKVEKKEEKEEEQTAAQ